jgi:hypothetical protein
MNKNKLKGGMFSCGTIFVQHLINAEYWNQASDWTRRHYVSQTTTVLVTKTE